MKLDKYFCSFVTFKKLENFAIGFPPDWPFADAFAANDIGYNGGVLEGYEKSVGSVTNAVCKVYNPYLVGGTIAFQGYVENGASTFLWSTTNAADALPYTFDSCAASTNWATFSDGSTIPAFPVAHLGINANDYEYTKNVLEYSRDTNGNVFIAGGLSTANGNGDAPVSISVGPSPFTFTNTTAGDIEVYVDAGTVTAIAKNGKPIFKSTGRTLHLQPSETFSLIYTSRPEASYSPL